MPEPTQSWRLVEFRALCEICEFVQPGRLKSSPSGVPELFNPLLPVASDPHSRQIPLCKPFGRPGTAKHAKREL